MFRYRIEMRVYDDGTGKAVAEGRFAETASDAKVAGIGLAMELVDRLALVEKTIGEVGHPLFLADPEDESFGVSESAGCGDSEGGM